MNEKIKELAEQAGYVPLPGFDFANSLQEVFMQKFAEVIVRECADRCFNIALKHREVETPRASGKKAGALECSEDLLAHFGVEP